MLDTDIDNEKEQKVLEFDFRLPMNKPNNGTNNGRASSPPTNLRRHVILANLLGFAEDVQLNHTFLTAAGLCDPFTQPEENEKSILSIDCLSDLLIAITYSYTNYIKDDTKPPKNDNEIHNDIPDPLDDEINNESENDSKTKSKNSPSNEYDEILNNPDINSIKFSLSTKYFQILSKIHSNFLNASDELNLRFVENDEINWNEHVDSWTPNSIIVEPEINLKVCYSMCCVLLVSIYKLFKPTHGDYNLALNPYLQYFIKLWKCHSNIIILGLEIDRRLENQNDENGTFIETPEIIKQTLRGSSSIRTVLAWILNQNPSLFYLPDYTPKDGSDSNHDISKESLLDFTHPLIRKNINGGALLIDMRLVIIAILIINAGTSYIASRPFNENEYSKIGDDERTRRVDQSKPITELGDLLIDLEYDDKFDEDIRYVFGHEYFGSDEEDDQSEVESQDDPESQTNGELEKRDNHEISDLKPNDTEGSTEISKAIRSLDGSNNIDFDEQGRDWRDLPRGENSDYKLYFLDLITDFNKLENKKDSDDFFIMEQHLYVALDHLTTDTTHELIGNIILNTIAKSVKDEDENTSVSSKSSSDKSDSDSITPDVIYKFLSSPASELAIYTNQSNNKLLVPIFTITNFELILHNNNTLARCIIDEMLMCKGYRRVLIWFLTHNINLSPLLIDYIFELLVGLRGHNKNSSPYQFSRKGDHLILSEVEQLMLLHEFLNNSSVYLSACDGVEIEEGVEVVLSESIARKLMTLLCLMITQLMKVGIINLDRKNEDDPSEDIHNYFNDLQVLLINWVGKLPEARSLFFRVKEKNYSNETIESSTDNDKDHAAEQKKTKDNMIMLLELVKKYSKLPISMINDHIKHNQSAFVCLNNFAFRLEKHLKTIIAFQNDELDQLHNFEQSDDLTIMHEDFYLFITNFNTLCKIEHLAETLFLIFEKVVSTGSVGNTFTSNDGDESSAKETELDEKRNYDAEFNDQFLNGEGVFNEIKSDNDARLNTGESKSKKKKKKKKSRKK